MSNERFPVKVIPEAQQSELYNSVCYIGLWVIESMLLFVEGFCSEVQEYLHIFVFSHHE